jgi:type I site-specific restriction endonuclease
LPTPEEAARAEIDRQLEMAGWVVQDIAALNRFAGRGVAVREFRLTDGHGRADYMLYVDGKAVGVVEAKPASTTLTGVEPRAERYSRGLTGSRQGARQKRAAREPEPVEPAAPCKGPAPIHCPRCRYCPSCSVHPWALSRW